MNRWTPKRKKQALNDMLAAFCKEHDLTMLELLEWLHKHLPPHVDPEDWKHL